MVELEIVALLPAATISILNFQNDYLLSQYIKKTIVATRFLVKSY